MSSIPDTQKYFHSTTASQAFESQYSCKCPTQCVAVLLMKTRWNLPIILVFKEVIANSIIDRVA